MSLEEFPPGNPPSSVPGLYHNQDRVSMEIRKFPRTANNVPAKSPGKNGLIPRPAGVPHTSRATHSASFSAANLGWPITSLRSATCGYTPVQNTGCCLASRQNPGILYNWSSPLAALPKRNVLHKMHPSCKMASLYRKSTGLVKTFQNFCGHILGQHLKLAPRDRSVRRGHRIRIRV